MYQKSNQFLNSLFSCESKLIGILCQNFSVMWCMVPLLAWTTSINRAFMLISWRKGWFPSVNFVENEPLIYCERKMRKILMEILYFLSNCRFLVSVSVRPSFGGLISVSVSVRPKPKKSFRSLTNFGNVLPMFLQYNKPFHRQSNQIGFLIASSVVELDSLG